MSKQEFVIFYCRGPILTNTSRELLKSHAMKCNRAADRGVRGLMMSGPGALKVKTAQQLVDSRDPEILSFLLCEPDYNQKIRLYSSFCIFLKKNKNWIEMD